MNQFIDVARLLFILFIFTAFTYCAYLIDVQFFGKSSHPEQMLYID